jgi:hypothetical protein
MILSLAIAVGSAATGPLEKVVLLAAIVGMSDLAVPASWIGTNFELLDSGRPVSRLPGRLARPSWRS